jgi:hypothetical protein
MQPGSESSSRRSAGPPIVPIFGLTAEEIEDRTTCS